jgi:hypothetical protein
MAEKFIFYRNTKSRDDDEHEENVMEKADEEKELISYAEFLADVEGFGEITKDLGYGEDLPVQDDWSVSFHKSTYGGLPCRIFCHTECDFIFLRAEDSRMLHEHHAQDIDPVQWQRATGYGKHNKPSPR